MDNITPKELPNHRAYASRRALHGSTLIQETLYADDMGATMDSLREIPTSLHQNEDTQHELSIAKSPLRRDPGVWTYRACVSGLTLMWLTGFGVIVYGSLVQRITDTSSDGYEPSMPHHKAFAPFLRLAISAAVTGFSEIAGLIHSTSLRFTLLAEGKLTFNSNLRLFTSCSAYSRVHWWPINIIWLWSLISSYACGSMVLLQTVYAFNGNYSPDIVSGYALIFLGFGLLGQASIATWALRANEFLTWSTNPIFIASLCREQGYLHVSHRRTMLSVHDAQIIGIYEIPQLPKARQRSLLNAHAQVRQVLIASWIVTLFGFLFFAAISLVYQFVDSPGPTWGELLALLHQRLEPHSKLGRHYGIPCDWNHSRSTALQLRTMVRLQIHLHLCPAWCRHPQLTYRRAHSPMPARRKPMAQNCIAEWAGAWQTRSSLHGYDELAHHRTLRVQDSTTLDVQSCVRAVLGRREALHSSILVYSAIDVHTRSDGY